jgi:hypothetical protein
MNRQPQGQQYLQRARPSTTEASSDFSVTAASLVCPNRLKV